MSSPIATYSFLPWLRQGLANQVQSADNDPAVKTRAGVNVSLQITADKVGGGSLTDSVSRDVALFGPGDIQGVDSRAIVRTEPRNWTTSYEPNYFADIEFYDEDFPWRYTPAAPDVPKSRLRPWIMLLVLKESEFTEGKNIKDKPLAYVDVPDLTVFPPKDQLWAWAHVHVNRALSDTDIVSADTNAVLAKFKSTLNENADLAFSRIMSPRRLEPTTAYHAFLMPVFETGRLAGLGLDPAASPFATFSAWDPYPAGTRGEPSSFPYYYRWFFQTASAGDFESLVRLLQPKPVDVRVGRRDIDAQDPGSNVRGVDNPQLKGVLKLGGALQVPLADFAPDQLVERNLYESWATPYPRPIQQDIAAFVNLADDYAAQAPAAANPASQLTADVQNDPDPLITPPLYGTWHALTKRLLKERNGAPVAPNNNWVHELNLDPRFRVAAAFGTRVVQDQQETLMDQAWEQIGKVLEANKRIRRGQFSHAVSSVWFDRHLTPLNTTDPQKSLQLMAPVNKRVMSGNQTLYFKLGSTFAPPAITSAQMRRMTRPSARLMQVLPFNANITTKTLLARAMSGTVSATPPKTKPSGLPSIDDLANKLDASAKPTTTPPVTTPPVVTLPPVATRPPILTTPIVVTPPITTQPIAPIHPIGPTPPILTTPPQLLLTAVGIRESSQVPGAIAKLKPNSNFSIITLGQTPKQFEPGPEKAEGTKFRVASEDVNQLLAASALAGAVPAKTAFNLVTATQSSLQQLKPDQTIPKRILATLNIPARILSQIAVTELFVEAMAYPEFDIPMYEPLKNLDKELFLPNINLLEQNSITLLETNQKFIEAYMVGLNHEFARELLWREYPTDQRGSYFRQFWDPKGFYDENHLTPDQLKEKLRDIPPLHLWPKASALGAHDNRQSGGGPPKAEAVLVIRGELLKRYPNAVIYAHRACWQRKEVTAADKALDPCSKSGAIDPSVERLLSPLTAAEEANPPRSKVRTPLYEAKVDPDIYFFGFDLTVDQAKGQSGEHPTDDPGWFFVIKERPGEPRFGLDIDKADTLNTWNDLAWPNVLPDASKKYLEISGSTPSLALVKPTGPEAEEKLDEYNDDKNVAWNANMSAADLAYILFQAPVLVAIHASEMLRLR